MPYALPQLARASVAAFSISPTTPALASSPLDMPKLGGAVAVKPGTRALTKTPAQLLDLLGASAYVGPANRTNLGQTAETMTTALRSTQSPLFSTADAASPPRGRVLIIREAGRLVNGLLPQINGRPSPFPSRPLGRNVDEPAQTEPGGGPQFPCNPHGDPAALPLYSLPARPARPTSRQSAPPPLPSSLRTRRASPTATGAALSRRPSSDLIRRTTNVTHPCRRWRTPDLPTPHGPSKTSLQPNCYGRRGGMVNSKNGHRRHVAAVPWTMTRCGFTSRERPLCSRPQAHSHPGRPVWAGGGRGGRPLRC